MRQRFVEDDVKNVPEEPGIFSLFQESDLVYIGRTEPRTTLRSELERALKVAMADENMEATHFTYELTPSPKTRAGEELRSYFETWGRLPVYNRPQKLRLERSAEVRR